MLSPEFNFAALCPPLSPPSLAANMMSPIFLGFISTCLQHSTIYSVAKPCSPLTIPLLPRGDVLWLEEGTIPVPGQITIKLYLWAPERWQSPAAAEDMREDAAVASATVGLDAVALTDGDAVSKDKTVEVESAAAAAGTKGDAALAAEMATVDEASPAPLSGYSAPIVFRVFLAVANGCVGSGR